MKKIKNFTVLFDLFTLEEIHLYKDVGMIPHYLHKLFGMKASIVCFERPQNRNLPDVINDVRIVRIRNWLGIFFGIPLIKKLRQLQIFAYIIKKAKETDALNLYHFTLHSILNGLLYKRINPAGILYLKMDDDLFHLKKSGSVRKSSVIPLWCQIVKSLEKSFLKACDVISIETKEGESLIRKNLPEFSEKLIYLPNGNDRLYIRDYLPKIKSFRAKENIILTVGRIGTRQKNNEMLLEAAARIDLKDWKVCLAGKIDPKFLGYIQAYFRKYPQLREKVIFTGELPDRRELFKWYDRAKVFCLTSDWESFGIVLSEAAYFGDYIISTDVGAARDITGNGGLGRIISVGDSASLVRELQGIISGTNSIESVSVKIRRHANENFDWEKLAEQLYQKMRFVPVVRNSRER